MYPRIRVRLTVDLTRYHPRLVPGVEGYTVGEYGMWSRGSDHFVGVAFPGIGTFDILRESLDIIDEAYLAEAARREAERWEALKSAKNVVKGVGPRGGFRYLSYEYTDQKGVRHHTSTGSREESEKLIEFFNKRGIPMRETVIK
jgi:hypothetical protein